MTAARTLEDHLKQQQLQSQNFFWNRLRWELVTRQIPGGRPLEVVDVGAGTGFLGDHLAVSRPMIEYRFVEPIPSLERGLEERFGAEANRRDADFGSAEFATLLDVLEHQEDDESFLADLAERLAPGSILLLTVPAMPSLWSSWDEMLGHYRRYTTKSVAAAVADLPLEIEEAQYIFPELVPIAGFRRAWRSLRRTDEQVGTEFPDLSAPLNRSLYALGRMTMSARGMWPVGTSVFARLRRL